MCFEGSRSGRTPVRAPSPSSVRSRSASTSFSRSRSASSASSAGSRANSARRQSPRRLPRRRHHPRKSGSRSPLTPARSGSSRSGSVDSRYDGMYYLLHCACSWTNARLRRCFSCPLVDELAMRIVLFFANRRFYYVTPLSTLGFLVFFRAPQVIGRICFSSSSRSFSSLSVSSSVIVSRWRWWISIRAAPKTLSQILEISQQVSS